MPPAGGTIAFARASVGDEALAHVGCNAAEKSNEQTLFGPVVRARIALRSGHLGRRGA